MKAGKDTVGVGVIYSDRTELGVECIHCGRRCGNLAGGFARISGEPVCSKPTAPDRPDCYRLITMKFHKLHDCPDCRAMVGTFTYPSPPRRTGLGRLPG